MYISKTIFSIIILTVLSLSPIRTKEYEVVYSIKIDSIGIDEKLYLSFSASTLEKGLILDPDSLNSNNLIIYGHRFSSRNPLKKYLRDLDRVKIEDIVILKKGERYFKYKVSNIMVVGRFDLWAISNTKTPTLTIVTCTPIFNPVNRLIVIADLVSIY